PPELAGILTGVLLLATISADWLRSPVAAPSHPTAEEGFVVKNAQVAVLSAVILVAALIVAGSNWLLVRSLRQEAGGSAGASPSPANPKDTPQGKPITVAMMPKSKGNAYFIACRKGAEEAAKELGVTLLWDGPTDPDPAKQNEIIDTWITRG